MGWSCSSEAGAILERWRTACYANTRQQNVYEAGGKRYVVDLSRTEHEDGAITGRVSLVTETKPDGGLICRTVNTFRIEGDGTITRAPAFLRRAALPVAEPTGLAAEGG